MMYAADFALSEGGAQARIFLLVRSRPLSLHAHPDPTAAPLVDLDPELAAHVPAEQLPAVRRALRVPVSTITRSERPLAWLVGSGGFVVLDGVVIGRLAVAGSVGLE